MTKLLQVFPFLLLAALPGEVVQQDSAPRSSAQPAEPERANLAIVAQVSTSFVSGHESLDALNDGHAPRRSRDNSQGAYGNWPRRGTQWIQYDWPKPVSINGAAVYWYIDGRGLHAPAEARLRYWDGNDWAELPGAGKVGLEADRFNEISFEEVTTTRLRLEIDAAGEHSTGVLEWRVFDSGNSPDFAPIPTAGPDRTVVAGSVTYLNGSVRTTGKPGAQTRLTWRKVSGPGEVSLEQPSALVTTARFSVEGEYQLALEAGAGELAQEDTLRVRVIPPPDAATLRPVPTTRYRLNSPFWNQRVKNLIVNWIPHCIQRIDEPDLKEGGINNIISAGNKLAGKDYKPHIGYPFSNAWVLNTIEAMCIAQMVDAQGDEEILHAQQAMRAKLDEWIPLLLAAQEPDGYFQTRFTLGTARDGDRSPQRWSAQYRTEHEGYVAGYFLEAAIAHYRATGGRDRRLYDAALRLADCWVANIGPGPRKPWYDGHQGMELALFRFARLVDEVEGAGKGQQYAQLAQFLLENRGQAPEGPEAHYGLGSAYHQAHLPVIQQYEALGHAVRAVYNYTAMAEVARATGDANYLSAVHSLWDNIVNRKYYVTGGVGSGETAEGFGGDYSLPNDAYCESCSGAGMIFFAHRMNLALGDAQYVNIYEETLYNAVLSDIDLEGQNFTYTNALDTSESRYKWHVCPCCVGNIPRTLLSLPTWTYAVDDGGIYVNLFIGSTMTLSDVAGTDVQLVQETRYPWDGSVSITVNPAQARRFALRVRIPRRRISEIYQSAPPADALMGVRVNGEDFLPHAVAGYAVIERDWQPGDRVEIELRMAVQKVHAIEQVEANRGRVALRYGPLVYNIESADQDVEKPVAAGAEFRIEWARNGRSARRRDGDPRRVRRRHCFARHPQLRPQQPRRPLNRLDPGGVSHSRQGGPAGSGSFPLSSSNVSFCSLKRIHAGGGALGDLAGARPPIALCTRPSPIPHEVVRVCDALRAPPRGLVQARMQRACAQRYSDPLHTPCSAASGRTGPADADPNDETRNPNEIPSQISREEMGPGAHPWLACERERAGHPGASGTPAAAGGHAGGPRSRCHTPPADRAEDAGTPRAAGA